MNSTSGRFDTRPPSKQYRAFTRQFGPVLRSFDPLGELILLPGLIAARGRASSFSHWTNKVGFEFKAECHYLNAANMDGYAGSDAGTCYLSVCEAVAYAMLDIFSLLFSVPTFFPSVGDSTLEDVERVASREKPLGYGLFRGSNAQVIDFERDIVPPRCSIRGLAALYFSGMAMDMIWTHELSHGVHGHIDFAQANLGLRALSEQPRGEGDLRLMPMEAEADRFAVISIVQTAMVGDAAPYLPLQLRSLSPEIRVQAALVVAALLTWFWAFQQRIDRTYDGLDPYTTGSHPPPLVRLHLAFDMARQFLSQQGWPTPMIEKTVFEAMINLEALASAKSWFSILDGARSFGEQANGFVQDVKRIMGDSYREIEASLAPYRFSKPGRPNEPLNNPSPVLT